MNFLNSLFLGTPATLFVFGAYALAKQYLDPRLPEIDDSTLLEMWKISFALSTLNMGLLKAIEVYNNLRLTRTMNHCGHSGKWKLNQVLYKKDNFSGDLSSATTSYWFDYVMQRDR